MSHEAVEVVRRMLDAFPDRVDEMLAALDEDVELRSAIVGGAEGASYFGHEGVRAWLAEVFGSFDELENEWTDLCGIDERVLAFGRVRARGRESGVELDSEMGWLVTVRGSKVVRAEGYLSHARAREAAGLQDPS